MTRNLIVAAIAAVLLAGCEPDCVPKGVGARTDALSDAAWAKSEWISAPGAKTKDFKEVKGGHNVAEYRAESGTSWFATTLTNAKVVRRAVWMTTGLGVYDVYVNGKTIGNDILKPGFTHVKKTRRSFTYDVTEAFDCAAGAKNVLAAEVSAGWWRDKIVNFAGKKSAFRGVLEVTYEDGTKAQFGSNARDWKAGVMGPVTHAAIFDGEEYDARQRPGYERLDEMGPAERNDEFKGEILPSEGAEICRRWDLVMAEGPYSLKRGEKLTIDFGQNCAGVPAFRFKAAEGTVLTALPAEMINDADKGQRGCDGPKGTIYRANLRCPDYGMKIFYTFAGKGDYETYIPKFTFFGYRYVELSATGDVEIDCVASVPVTSITKAMEIGSIETGDKCVNRLIANVYWGQLSNYLSVPTDCPQRNERLGWTADTQVFTEAGSFNADTQAFFHKWMRDMRDSQDPRGGFPGVAPWAQYGNDGMRIGWSDAGIIVPWTIWKQFGDVAIIEENWAAMERCMARQAETKYQTDLLPECWNYQWSDWLSLTKYESNAYKPEFDGFEKKKGPDGKIKRGPKPVTKKWWNYLGGAYWVWNSDRMAIMAQAIGKDSAKYTKMAEQARAYMKSTFFATKDGTICDLFEGMQTAYLFALKLNLVEGEAKAKTIAALRKSIADNGETLHTGFLGTSIAMDTLTENGMADLAYSLLLNHKFPGWLYSVDQGATTIWERWNSYTVEKGFGPVGMNSFNHYAYGAVLAWIYKTAAGIAADPSAPGYERIVMSPIPDRRLGSVKAEYRTPKGIVKSAWAYNGARWTWNFTVPEGATAVVTLPGEKTAKLYKAGDHTIVKDDLK